MTEREVLPVENLRSLPDYDRGDPWDVGLDSYGPDTYDLENYDPDYGPGWEHYRAAAHPARSNRPQRTSRLLLLLIGLAAAALVVAAALLVTGNFAGEIPSNPRLETRTSSAPVTSTSQPVTASVETTSSMQTTSPTSSTPSAPVPATQPSPEPPPAPIDPASSQPPAPPSERSNPQGPRINVTRTPMSFTPGIRGD